MRDSFIFYRSFYEAIKELPIENQPKVYSALFEYALNQNEMELTGIEKAIFSLVKPQLDANQNKYENGCKGGAPKGNQNAKKQPRNNLETTKKQPRAEKKQPNENDNENDNDNDNVNDNIYTLSEAEASTSDTAKASKHKYGEYKNVLLKDEELQALKRDYANWEELIKYLDEYIEMKGYKAKSHYLAIRKWVVEAVKRNGNSTVKKQNYANSDFGNLTMFYDNINVQRG